MIFRSCLSLLLAASAWGQFWGPQFRVMPKSDGSAVGELQWYGLTGTHYVGFVAPNSVPSTVKWKLPTSDALGALCSDGSGNLYFGCVGGSSGITILNSLTAPTQSLAIGVSGTAPNWAVTGGNTHVLNIPYASTASVTAGLISNANFAAFTAKQDAISASGPINFSSNIVSCATCVTGPGSSTVGYLPTWNNTGGTQLAAGYLASTSNVSNSVVVRDGSGGILGNIGYFTTLTAYPSTAATAILARRGTAGQTDPIHVWADQTGSQLSAIDKDGKFTGNAATATALAANGSNCSAGQAAAGVDAAGAAEGCFTPAGGGNVTGSGTTSIGMIPAYTDTTATGIGPGYIPSVAATASTLVYRNGSGDILGVAGSFTGQVTGSNVVIVPGSDIATGVFRRYSSGQANHIIDFQTEGGGALSAIDKDGHFTGRSATTLALAANGANCSAGQAAAGVDASGAAEGCFTPSGSGGSNLGIYNVKDSPYSAVGDGSNDDTAEIQAAIDACQDSTRGGIVYFPPGVYAISGELTMGNGSGGTESTKRPCMLEGAGGTGGGTSSNRQGASIIRWTGSAPGSTSYVLKFNGPFIGGGAKHLTLDVNSKSNLRGMLISTVSHGYFEALSIINYATLGMLVTATTVGSDGLYGACDNYFSHLRIVWPATGGSGLALEGNDVSGGMDSCSNNFYGGMIWHDNGTSGTYGVNLGFADNNRFWSVNIYGFPESSTNGSAIKFTQATNNANFPHENTFVSVSAHQGVTGTVGAGQPNIFYDWHLGDCWHNCDPYSVSGSTKPIVFSTDRSLKGVTVPGEFVYTGTDENNKTLLINHSSGGQNGAGNLVFQRAGSDMARIKGHYFDGLEFFTSDGSGGTPSSKMRLKTTGVLKISNATRTTVNGISAEVGDMIICTDCARDASCTASGTGALAKAITAGTGIGNWVCN